MASPPNFDRYRPHPWHGLDVGANAPDLVNVYVEMTPADWVKYEIDKESGYLIIDRPRRLSSQLPMAYGFIPRTYCAERVAALSDQADEGDLDPLDICVISDCPIDNSQILLEARIVGGLHMVDGGEADDKIIAVLSGDCVWGEARDIGEIPHALVARLRHYFLTYKMVPGEKDQPQVAIETIYGADHAKQVLAAAMADYSDFVDQ